MNSTRLWRPGAVAVACLAGISAGLLHGCTDDSTSSAVPRNNPSRVLTIVTPHSEKIREAFEIGFNSWRARQKKPYCRFQWIMMGTPQCIEYINSVFTLTRDDRPRKIPDLMFGGGVQDHQFLADRNYCEAFKLADVIDKFPVEIGGQPTHDEKSRWFSTGMTSFGIVFNERLCQKRGKAPPRSWEDMADPRFSGWIGLAHPRTSGTTQRCMSLILQKQGWERGWATLMGIFANSRGLLDRSRDVLQQVRNGIFLASMAVNFDGLELVALTNSSVAYTNPPGASALSPDVISVLRCGKDHELAEEFLRYCLMEEGQMLWGVRSEYRGAYSDTLYHYPIDPGIYERFSGKLAVPDNPLKVDLGLSMDLEHSQQRANVLILVADALGGDNHILLQEAWNALIASGASTAALAELTAPPCDEVKAVQLSEDYGKALFTDPNRAAEIRADLAKQLEARFRRILATTKQG